VSANYALKDGNLIATVDESKRAWTSASYEWDRRAVTIECCNSTAGGKWPVSDATFDTLARLIADVSARYGFEINDTTILTHQELYTRYGASYATACPGDLERRKGELLNLARKYRGQGPVTASTKPAADVGYVTVNRSIKSIQKLVGANPDGIYGPDTTAKVKVFQKNHKLTADGIWGPKSDAAGFPKNPNAFPLPDSTYYFGPEYPLTNIKSVSGYYGHGDDLKKFQKRLIALGYKLPKYGADGRYGDETAKAIKKFQKAHKLTVDGLVGPVTWKAAFA
jgi:peptidoglycan hydrolase-like protein with peptidoglycan-binding domain